MVMMVQWLAAVTRAWASSRLLLFRIVGRPTEDSRRPSSVSVQELAP
jgi:hypothetical protein